MAFQTISDLSDEELDRIEQLSKAATAGPWFSYVAGRDPEADTDYIELGSCNELGTYSTLELVGATIADQEFIAAARQDVPRLLFEVRMLRARLRDLNEAQGNAEAGDTHENVHVPGARIAISRHGPGSLR